MASYIVRYEFCSIMLIVTSLLGTSSEVTGGIRLSLRILAGGLLQVPRGCLGCNSLVFIFASTFLTSIFFLFTTTLACLVLIVSWVVLLFDRNINGATLAIFFFFLRLFILFIVCVEVYDWLMNNFPAVYLPLASFCYSLRSLSFFVLIRITPNFHLSRGHLLNDEM